MRYVIITPVKNEEQYIEHTLRSVTGQTLKPAEWIIVNDDSTDSTRAIAEQYERAYEWIRIVDRGSASREKASGGANIVKLFYKGYDSLSVHDYDVIVKLDADVTLPTNYFEKVVSTFASDPSVGLCGGYCVINRNGILIDEFRSSSHLRGPIKAYRKKCFEQIGGLTSTFNWDSLDEIMATYYGWKVKILPLQVLHHRPTSSNINKGVRISFIAGREDYRFGYNIMIALVRALSFGIRTRPFVISGVAFLMGYTLAFMMRERPILDRAMRKHANVYKRRYFMERFRRIWQEETQ